MDTQAETVSAMPHNRLLRGAHLALSRLEDAMSVVGAAMAAIMMLLISADVLGRRFFERPVTGTFETVENYLMVAIFWLCLPRVERQKEHVSVDFLIDRLPRRPAVILAAVAATVMALLLGYAGYLSLERAGERWSSISYNTVVPLPVGLSWLLLGSGLLLTSGRMLLALAIQSEPTSAVSVAPKEEDAQ